MIRGCCRHGKHYVQIGVRARVKPAQNRHVSGVSCPQTSSPGSFLMRLYCPFPSHRALIVPLLIVLLVSACTRSGPVRRISEPAASIQQLSVAADGHWSLELRLQNFSSIPMRFDKVALVVSIGDMDAGRLESDATLTVGPESADILKVTMQPSAQARLVIANALAGGRGIAYRIEGTLEVSPHDRDKTRSYAIYRTSTLNPAPGLPGVLR